MRTLIKHFGIGMMILLGGNKVFGQCSSCNTTISTAYSGNIVVAAGNKLCITSTGSVTGTIQLNAYSKICNQGTVVLSALTSTATSIVENRGTFNVSTNLSLNGTLSNEGDVLIDGNFISSALINNSGNMIIQGEYTNSTASGALLTNAGFLKVMGDFTNDNDLFNKSGGFMLVTGSFENSSSAGTSFLCTGDITVLGDFSNSNDFECSGNVVIGGYFDNTTATDATVTTDGDFKVKGSFRNANDFNNSGTFVVDGDFNQSNAVDALINNDGEMTFRGDLTSDNDITNTGIISVAGVFTNNARDGVYLAYPASLLVVDSLINNNNISSASAGYAQIQVLSYCTNSGDISTYLDVCILSNRGNWNSNTGRINARVTNCTTLIAIPKVCLNIKLYLESTYNAVNGNMDCNLRSSKALPSHQPFTANPWSYSGTENVDDSISDISVEMVDWVKIELRSERTVASKFFEGTYFLNNNGNITDSKGAPVMIDYPAEKKFYIAIIARNHLSVMSSDFLAVNGGVITYDFTTAQSKAYTTGTDAMVEVQRGIFALYTGDVNGDGTINAEDAFDWYMNSGSTGYIGADLNMDNGIDMDDISLWRNRNGMSVQFILN